MKPPLALVFALSAAAAMSPSRAGAQAFTAPQGLGSVTLAWQYVENTGHLLSDGLFVERGQSVSMSALIEVDYAVTDRLSVTGGIPYVSAKYTGALPPVSGLAIDSCKCWQSAFQDFSLAARYRFGDDTRAVTPMVRLVLPSHAYRYRGEAVVGKQLQEVQVGVSGGLRLTGVLKKASVQTSYVYSFVEKPLRDVSINRSNVSLSLGYALSDRLFIHVVGAGQRTHGGLHFGSPTGRPFFPPGEFTTPERLAQRDRLLRVEYAQAGGGVSYSAGPADLYISATRNVWGRNTHRDRSYNVGVTWYFDRFHER